MEKKHLFFLFLIIIVGLVFRFYDLGEESIWTDEAVTLSEAKQPTPAQIINKMTRLEGSPYGYFLLLHYWINYFGDSEFSIRFLSAIFGILLIPTLFFLVRKFYSDKIALLSALFLSTAMLQVVYSQEARIYSLFGFLVLLSTFFFVRFSIKNGESKSCLNKHSQRKYVVAYIITTAIAMYVNYLTIFLLMLHLLLFYVKGRRNMLKTWLYSLFVILVLSIPLIKLITVQFLIGHARNQIMLQIRGLPLFLSELGLFLYTLPLLFVFSILVLVIVFCKKKKIKVKFNEKIFLTVLIATGILYFILLDFISRSFSLIRHSYFMVPIIYVFMAKGIVLMKNRKLKIFLVIIILLLNSFALYNYYTETTKAPWREAVQYLEENSALDTLILFERSGSNVFIFDYYRSRDFRLINLARRSGKKLYKINESELKEILSEEDSFWLISSRDFYTKDYYENILNKNYKLILSKNYKELVLYKYEKS